jgi:hypothetical protein
VAGPFDLSKFAPPATTEFKLRNGRVYKVSPDPDVDVVARMLRIEGVMRGAEEGEMADALAEGKQIVCDLIRDEDPDADLANFKIGPQELLIVMGLMLHGESVAQAVLEAISPPSPDGDPEGASEAGGAPERPHDTDVDEDTGEVSPLPSERRSPERSSVLGDPDAGLRATGTD